MSLDPNMTSYIQMKIYNELSECSGMLNLDDIDRKLYEMCMKDFWDYLTYLRRNHLRVEEGDIQNQSMLEFTIEENEFGFIVHSAIKGANTKEVDEFIHMFVQQWWKKYHVRCKIVFTIDKRFQPVKNIKTSHEFTEKERQEIFNVLIDQFIKFGEICCPSILATQLFMRTVEADSRKTFSMSDKLNLVTQLRREAKQMSYTHGPLIFFKPDKEYFLREWRDSNNADKIV